MTDSSQHYPRHTDAPVQASPDLPAIERGVLAFWKSDDTFQASIDQRPAGTDGDNEYVFYDGPPFANGLPHYGHLLTGYAKDVVPRYQTMRGKRVERRFGWDTHGLPAELEAMDQLGIKTKDEILAMGIGTFNEAARASVLKYTDEWEEYVTRQARWVDFDNDYKTLSPDYMESVLWAFKELWNKGLIYEGFRVLPYCWNDQTPLSNHELRMDEDVYASRQDPSVTAGYRLETGELALIWTTTPWTMPSNLLVVVGEDIDYVVVESEFTGSTERYILAEERLDAYARELAGGDVAALRERIVERLKGRDLVGRAYTPPFDYFLGHENAHRIVADDYVTTTDGTGLVHNAGAFGEEDKRTTDRENIAVVRPVGPDGTFTEPVREYAGMLVFDANAPILDHLKARTRGQGDAGATTPGTVLLRRETYDHNYPHCWRCRQPLIYMGVSSWFVEVTKIRDRMVELNREIDWVPAHIQEGQFGKWLSNARDWSISRNRFWGSPIPVWRSDDPAYPRLDVYGSFAELEADFGTLPRGADGAVDLHRPYIDELTRPNPDDPTGKSTMRRVGDVLDVWFDSGAMSFAQVHYPFENAEWFEHHFPADFIVEYINQTRGWFYTLHVLATALFDRPAFSTCICHGIILGNDGFKASKSRRNYPDVNESFESAGSDAVRWFLMSSPILRGGNLIVSSEGIRDAVRGVLLPLWSTWYFFSLYANTVDDGAGRLAQPVTSERVAQLGEMDRYLLARTHDLALAVTKAMDDYDIPGATAAIRDHLDVLTNWYVRTQRDRFWAEDHDAFDTLYTALEVLTRLMAPLAPMVTEEIWRGLTGGRSVHLTDWPVDVGPEQPLFDEQRSDGADPEPMRATTRWRPITMDPGLVADPELVAAMDGARAVVSVTHGLRKAHQLRVRQPLRRVSIASPDPAGLEPFATLIAEELNVKEVDLLDADDAADRFGVVTKLSVNARAAGPRLGREVQHVIAAARADDWAESGGVVTAGGIALQEGEYEIRTEAQQVDGSDRAVAMLPGGGFVVLDLGLDEALRAEGYARDAVRSVQEARKDAGLHVADRIDLTLHVPADWTHAVDQHRDFIASETLAADLTVRTGTAADLRIELSKAGA